MKGFKKMETDIKKPVGQVHWLFSRPGVRTIFGPNVERC